MHARGRRGGELGGECERRRGVWEHGLSNVDVERMRDINGNKGVLRWIEIEV